MPPTPVRTGVSKHTPFSQPPQCLHSISLTQTSRMYLIRDWDCRGDHIKSSLYFTQEEMSPEREVTYQGGMLAFPQFSKPLTESRLLLRAGGRLPPKLQGEKDALSVWEAERRWYPRSHQQPWLSEKHRSGASPRAGQPRCSKSWGGQRAQGVAEAGLRVTGTSTMW